MSDETIIDFERGSNSQYHFVFKDHDGVPFDLTGSRFILALKWSPTDTLTLDTSTDGGTLFVEYDVFIQPIDAEGYVADRLVWSRTLAQSRLLPLGALTHWAIERRNGDLQEAWGAAMFNGIGGLPPD